MNQGGARKPKPEIDGDDNGGSFLDDAFNERTMIHPGPSLRTPAAAPAPAPAAVPPAPAKKLEFEAPPQPPVKNSSFSALDDALNERTTVLTPRGAKPASDLKMEPLATDFEFTTPELDKTPIPDFKAPSPPRMPPAKQQQAVAQPSSAPAARAKNTQGSGTNPGFAPPSAQASDPAAPTTGSISFDRGQAHEAPATDDWDFRSEKTQAAGIQHWLRRANAIPRQHKIALGVIVAAVLAMVFFRGGSKPAEPTVVETEPKAQELAPAKPVVPTVDSVLQLFDIAYAKTQGQARTDQNSP